MNRIRATTPPLSPLSPLSPLYKKKKIPKAIREALWIKHHPSDLRAKCPVPWCPNTITAYDFQAGHRIPESRGGPTTIENLIPICSRCNLSMGSTYTYDDWCKLSKPTGFFQRFMCFSWRRTLQSTVEPAPQVPFSKQPKH